MFTADLFIIAKNLKQIPINKRIDNQYYIYDGPIQTRKDPISILVNLRNIVLLSHWTQKNV